MKDYISIASIVLSSISLIFITMMIIEMHTEKRIIVHIKNLWSALVSGLSRIRRSR
jgi:ribosomal protein RSM22 (predicted rRNA methylase)